MDRIKVTDMSLFDAALGYRSVEDCEAMRSKGTREAQQTAHTSYMPGSGLYGCPGSYG
jgi:hypothetical protein